MPPASQQKHSTDEGTWKAYKFPTKFSKMDWKWMKLSKFDQIWLNKKTKQKQKKNKQTKQNRNFK